MPRHVRQTRIEQGRKLRAMYRSLGLSRAQCAQFLHVSLRTLHNWESGTHAIPFAAFKLLRIHCHMELPGAAWRGWSLSRGKLCTPEGHELDPRDAAWWSLLVRRAETGVRAITALTRLRESIAAAAPLPCCREPAGPGQRRCGGVSDLAAVEPGSATTALVAPGGTSPPLCNTGGK